MNTMTRKFRSPKLYVALAGIAVAAAAVVGVSVSAANAAESGTGQNTGTSTISSETNGSAALTSPLPEGAPTSGTVSSSATAVPAK